jgi:hypothetical protein
LIGEHVGVLEHAIPVPVFQPADAAAMSLLLEFGIEIEAGGFGDIQVRTFAARGEHRKLNLLWTGHTLDGEASG